MKKFLLTAISCVTLLCVLCSCSLLGITEFNITENGDEATFAGVGDCKDAEIVVPDTYKKKPITAIGDRAFYYNAFSAILSEEDVTEITSITLPETIESIGKEAFYGNKKLTTLNIPASVKTIGQSAFNGCSSLTTLVIPEGVTEIQPYTFADCSSLTSIQLPSTVKTIGQGAFSGCSSLKTIDLPAGLEIIPPACFEGCSSLETFPISETITVIGEKAFEGCKSLGKVAIPSTVTILGARVFEDCGENVEVHVSYDTTPPAEWDEQWYMNSQGSKIYNDSEVYMNTVIAANKLKAAELQTKIESCKAQYKALTDEISELSAARNNQYISNEAYKEYNRQIRACQEQRSEVSSKQSEYQEELDDLQLTNQLAGPVEEAEEAE